MKSAALPVPGLRLGSYPERPASEHDTLSRVLLKAGAAFSGVAASRPDRHKNFLSQAVAEEAALEGLTAEGLAQRAHQARVILSRDGLVDHAIALAFALIRKTCVRELGVRPFDTQLIAARVMLEGRLAEMATGEGKTLAAGVCAATASLAGIPVHVITANDYLVSRDAEFLRPLYAALGLDVGAVTQSMDLSRRQQVYRGDVTYCTAKELVFDYLRDRIVRRRGGGELAERAARIGNPADASKRTLLRGLCMAIIDEADSILIDEARVPLILSELRSSPAQHEYHGHALQLALQMAVGPDFSLERGQMTAGLTSKGREKLDQWSSALGPAWRNRLHREETIELALAALHLFQRDRHYLLHDGTVAIIDETTGRLAAGRVWSRGLQQLIEMKEGCKPSPEQVTAAQITYQRFFQRYLRLGGMSGTLREARTELRSVYDLQVEKVPLRRPGRRHILRTRLYADRKSQWRAVVDRAVKVSGRGRPVLIGTDSVADSESLSAQLHEAGVAHAVLNARQDRNEAAIVAGAGQAGRITVATNMAGRGTDIPLGRSVAESGGLHIICCQHNASRRIDRQLVGRSARQGDPGSAESLLSLDKPLISCFLPGWVVRLTGADGLVRPQWLIRLLVLAPQLLEEKRHRAQRAALLKQDLDADRDLSMGGRLE
jgi:preprotein translocase subunit SecA